MKIKEEELLLIQEQQKQLSELINNIGILETQKHGLLHDIAGVNKEIEDYKEVLVPSDRYANMPNVWSVHNEIGLEKIILEQGLEIIDSTEAVMTTVEEQRATQWMPFRSFESALEEGNPERTIEGFPAPLRKFVVITIQSNQL